jgi:hypothetical protein
VIFGEAISQMRAVTSPVPSYQSRTVRSEPPDASVLPSGLNAIW